VQRKRVRNSVKRKRLTAESGKSNETPELGGSGGVFPESCLSSTDLVVNELRVQLKIGRD
jgi:hypothetical protein